MSDAVTEPSFSQNTFLIPLQLVEHQIYTDSISFEVFIGNDDNDIHTRLGAAQVDFQYPHMQRTQKPFDILRVVLNSTSQPQRGSIMPVQVGSFRLTLQLIDPKTELITQSTTNNNFDFDDTLSTMLAAETTMTKSSYNSVESTKATTFSLNESQHLERILARSFIEGTENPMHEESALARLLTNHNFGLLDKSDLRQKWQTYTHIAQNLVAEFANAKKVFNAIKSDISVATSKRNDMQAGLRLLRQLLTFNMRRLDGEEDLSMHVYVDGRVRRLSVAEIVLEMKRTVHSVQRWQELNSAVEQLLINAKGYISNIGELRELYSAMRSNYKENLSLRSRIVEEASHKDYYVQKVQRQDAQIHGLAQVMERVTKNAVGDAMLAESCIDLQGDILTAHKNIKEKVYGNTKEQEEELEVLRRQCVKLVKVEEQQRLEIEASKSRIAGKAHVDEYYALRVRLSTAEARVKAVEEQIKKSGEEFSKELVKFALSIEEQKQMINTFSISSISYVLPKEINPRSDYIMATRSSQ